MTPPPLHRTEVTEDHQRLVYALVCSLRDAMHADDALIVCCVGVAHIALNNTASPAEVIDNALITIAQLLTKDRGEIAKAVLDVLAEQMEPSSV